MSLPRIFTGGRLLPLDGQSQAHRAHFGGVSAASTSRPGEQGDTALVVHDGTIAFVGTDEGARAFASGAPETVLRGRLVTPAFVDAHVHLVQTGQTMSGLDLSATRSRDQVLSEVERYARHHRSVSVIVGQGWDERGWPDARAPQRGELDRASGGAAVYLARVDVHSAVVSTALLEQLPGIEDEPGFRADGLLTREAHHRSRQQMDGLFTDAERRSAARAALLRAAEVGLGSVHELGGPHLGPLEDLNRIREVAGEIGIDLVSYWGELASPESIERARSVGAAGLAGDLCVDGSIGSRTAALVDPYTDAETSGMRYLSLDEITEHLVLSTGAGLQAGFHCIGDDAVAAAVEGLRRAAELVGDTAIRASRHRLEHVEMLAAGDVGVLATLGVVASMQPAFDAAWGPPGELYEQRLGRTRSVAMNRLQTLARAGVPLALGSDSPVTPLTGWETVRAAVQHCQPSERMGPADAFRAATRGGHAAARDELSGRLGVGAPATLAVWDDATGLSGGGTSWDVDGFPDLTPDAPLPTCAMTMTNGRVIFAGLELDPLGSLR